MTGTSRCPLDHRLKRREDLLVGQIAVAPKNTKVSEWESFIDIPSTTFYLRLGFFHVSAELEAHGGEQPCRRSRPRRARRSARKARVVSTGTGTPSSMAALIVQRPSPESETRPANFVKVRVLQPSALAVRSSSHEAMTLPRRQTSATSREVEVVLVVLGIAQRRRLRVDLRCVACRHWRA